MSTDRNVDDAAVAAEVQATREEHADEEAEASEAEASCRPEDSEKGSPE